MRRPGQAVFLERQTYRRRRLGDAARLVPILGLILFLLPILWADSARTAGGMLYLFSAWVLLIVLIGVLSARLTRPVADTTTGAPEDGPDD